MLLEGRIALIEVTYVQYNDQGMLHKQILEGWGWGVEFPPPKPGWVWEGGTPPSQALKKKMLVSFLHTISDQILKSVHIHDDLKIMM